MDWISVKDFHPPEPENKYEPLRYLVLQSGFWPGISYYKGSSGDEWEFDDITQWEFGDITHWMPLPEPPKNKHEKSPRCDRCGSIALNKLYILSNEHPTLDVCRFCSMAFHMHMKKFTEEIYKSKEKRKNERDAR